MEIYILVMSLMSYFFWMVSVKHSIILVSSFQWACVDVLPPYHRYLLMYLPSPAKLYISFLTTPKGQGKLCSLGVFKSFKTDFMNNLHVETFYRATADRNHS